MAIVSPNFVVASIGTLGCVHARDSSCLALCGDELYSMRAYEVDKDGEVIVTIVVPHDSDALEHQGAYRFIPWATTAGESNTAPFDLATKAVQPSWRRRARL